MKLDKEVVRIDYILAIMSSVSCYAKKIYTHNF